MTMKEKNLLIKKAMLALCLMTVCWLPTKADVLAGDVNSDGEVNIADVTALIDMLLNPQQPPEPIEDWVDLGLPSGTIWATRNVGASVPEDYGYYFAWGETEPKSIYNWYTYKWCNGSWNSMTKYCIDSYYGSVDNKRELDPEDDAAYVNWGPSWRMPSLEQFRELRDHCTWTWTTRNGVNGQLVTGLNGNTLFLPAAGYRLEESLYGAGSWGNNWSRTLCPDDSHLAYGLNFNSGDVSWNSLNRLIGFTVRAVRVSQN